MPLGFTTTQGPFCFSGDSNLIRFTGVDAIEDSGFAAIAELTITGPVPVGTEIPIQYGNELVVMTAVALPDDSGTQFLAGDGSIEYVGSQLVEHFKSNFVLSRDFRILADGLVIRFISRKVGYGFDIRSTAGANYSIALTGTGTPKKVRPKYSIYFELWLEDENHSDYKQIYSTNLPLLPTQDACEIDISSIIHNELLNIFPDIPSLNSTVPMVCKNTCRRYYFRFGESYGGSVRAVYRSGTYTAILGKLSYVGEAEKTINQVLDYFGNDRFLRQGPIYRKVLPNQPQFLYFFNTKTTAPNARLMVNFYFSDGDWSKEIVSIFQLEQYRKYGFNVRFDMLFNPDAYTNTNVISYEIWLEDEAGTRLCEYRTFDLDLEPKLFVRNFLYLNSWGAMDTMLCYGKGASSYEYSHKEVAKIRRPGYRVSDGDISIFDTRTQDKFKVSSGWVNKDQLILNRDFILSPKKFRYSGGRLLPIALESKDMEEMDDAETLYKHTFEYKYLFEDHAFTERNEDESEVFTERPQVHPVYFGPSFNKPISGSDLLALTSQPETLYQFTLNTGTTFRNFTVAVPPWKKLAAVTDFATEEDLTSLYKLSTIEIDGFEYRVYTMEMAIPYSVSHPHLIVLING